MKVFGFLFGMASYCVFLASFLYAIAFLANMFISKSVDVGPATAIGEAFIVNTLLLGLFAIPHSVMARPAFKAWWTKFIPASLERSTYVLISSLLLALLCLKWQVIPDVIWNVENRTLRAILDTLFWVGWLIVLASTFMINHFDLFGLRQVYLRLRNLDYTHLAFQTKWLYRFVRHPLMLGFIIVFWVTPIMTLGHLFFSLATTAYIFIGVYLEERDLITYLGQEYIQYQKDVPMLFPIPSRKSVPVSRDTGTE